MTIQSDFLVQSGFIVPEWPAPNHVVAGCTTRHALNGESRAPFDSLNLGLHVGDEPKKVLNNRSQLPFPSVTWLNQTHSVDVVQLFSNTRLQEDCVADASFTQLPLVTCAVMTADCLPVLLCDQRGTWVAAIHAGWRGLAEGVIENTLFAIASEMQFEWREVMAWIGPAIGQAAFEVGVEVKQAFLRHTALPTSAFQPSANSDDKFYCDLAAIAEYKLSSAGIDQVYCSNLCTFFDQQRFFSHRRDGNALGSTGRMASLICLQPIV